MTPEYQDYLAHYGVKGQRWGVRRYQDEEGDYTSEGRQHYGLRDERFAPERRDPSPRVMDEYRRMPSPRERMRKEREELKRVMEERQEKVRNVITIASTVAITAAVGYVAYRGKNAFKKWLKNAYKTRVDAARNQTSSMIENGFKSMKFGSRR